MSDTKKRGKRGTVNAVKFVAAAALTYTLLDTLIVRVIGFKAHFSDYAVHIYFFRSFVIYSVVVGAVSLAAGALGGTVGKLWRGRRPGVSAAAAGGALCAPLLGLAVGVNRLWALTITHPAMLACDVLVAGAWIVSAFSWGVGGYRRFGPGPRGFRRFAWAAFGYGGVALFFIVWFRVFALPTITRPAAPERGMNVLLISIDTLRRDHLGRFGYERVKTPNLDRFAASGATFENAYCNSPWTLPSMASLITGRYPAVCGVDAGHRIRPELPTLAELLREKGYRTEAYITNVFLHPEFGYARGFDVYLTNGDLRALYPLRGTLLYKWTVAAAKAARSRFGRISDDTTFNGEATGEALRRAARDERPFFIWCHFMDPHGPYTPPPGYVPDYPGIAAAEAYDLMEELLARGWGLDDMPMEKRFADKFEMLYDGEIAYVDEHFGKIMAVLEEEGLSDDTMVIVLNDHGEEFFDHGGFEHGHTLYPELIDMVLLVRVPGQDLRAAAAASYVSHVDVAPSILDALGLAPAVPFDGRSFLAPGPAAGTGAVFAEHIKRGTEKKAVRRGGWLLIQDWETGRRELYDLSSDPAARLNVAGKNTAEERALAREIAAYAAAAARTAAAMGEAPEIDLPEDQKRRLRGLGYFGP